jgi:hypothetical protein
LEVGHGDAARVSPVLPTFQQAAIGRWEREFRIRLARGHEFILPPQPREFAMQCMGK